MATIDIAVTLLAVALAIVGCEFCSVFCQICKYGSNDDEIYWLCSWCGLCEDFDCKRWKDELLDFLKVYKHLN